MDNQRDDSQHSVLVDANEDRWAWRARLKRKPTTRRLYRSAVALVGVALILLAVVTGPLPGPGGIPLALVGLAVLASEFDWAARLLERVKAQARRIAQWSRRQPPWVRWAGVVLTAAFVLLAFYLLLLAWGVPGWLPDQARNALVRVPGLG
ncbi:MAG: PGPGW domain-containing protein [Angustibacter sp.]